MKKRKIIEELREAGKPLTIDNLSERTDIAIPSLRMDLFRLQEEGNVKSVERDGKLCWKVKVSREVEERYEKMSKKNP
jgi:DNA-binding transcriptional ArsR family regulator